MREISSTGNSEIRQLAALRQKASERRRTGTFLLEGERLILDSPAGSLRRVYVTRGVFERLESRLPDEVTILSEAAMEKASGTQHPQGILAVAAMPQWTAENLLEAEGSPLLLILEDIQDPGNLGTMLRTAEAAGASGMILSKNTADLFNPKTVRATMSAVFRMPFQITEDLPGRIGELRRRHGVRVHAACLHGKCTSYETLDYRGPSAFLIGNEGNGLSQRSIEAADDAICLPMAGQIESLNAAMSAGILLYEAARQRGF